MVAAGAFRGIREALDIGTEPGGRDIQLSGPNEPN
jgi:hypothetical protein